MHTTRRGLLAAAGTVALAGCIGDNTDELEAELNATETTLASQNETLNETESTLAEREDELDETESALDTSEADQIRRLYRYAYALIAQGNEQYNAGTEAWNSDDYYAAASECERAYGLYASALAATEQCTDIAEEQSRTQSVHGMIDDANEYADAMGEASRDLAYAARAATRDDWGEADSYHEQATDAADRVRLSDLTEPDEFARDL